MMNSEKITLTIASQCLAFNGWTFIDCGVFQKGSKYIQVSGRSGSPSIIRIQECDENADELGEVYLAQTIGEFRDVTQLIECSGFSVQIAVGFLREDGWISEENGVYRKGSTYIQVGEIGAYTVMLQSFDIVSGGHGLVDHSKSLEEFKGSLYRFQSAMIKDSIKALGEVDTRLNNAIVASFGDFADWDNHAGVEDCTQVAEINEVVEGFQSDHTDLFKAVWSIREYLNSELIHLA